MKGFLKKITQNLKKRVRFSSRVFLNGRSRFGFLSNNFSKKRGFVFKSKKKTLYFRKLESYMYRFAVFKKLYVTFFEKKVKKENSQPVFRHKLARFKQVKNRLQFNLANNKLLKLRSENFKGNFKSFHKKHWRKKFRFNLPKQNGWFRGKHTRSSWVIKNNLDKNKNVVKKKKFRNRLTLKKQNVWKNVSKDKQNFRKRKLFFVFLGYKSGFSIKKEKSFKKRVKLNKRLYKTFLI